MLNIIQKLIDTKLFIENEYLHKYATIIDNNVQTKRVKGKTNSHHVIPIFCFKYLGQDVDNSQQNRVNLEFEDHIRAHFYLSQCSLSPEVRHANDLAVMFLTNNERVADEKHLEDVILELRIVKERWQHQQGIQTTNHYESLTDEQKKERAMKTSEKNKQLITINKDEMERRIYPHQLEEFLASGWKRGRAERSKKSCSESKKGNIPWNKGMRGQYKLGRNEKIVQKLIGHTVSEEARKHISEKNKGKIYIHKDTVVKKINPEQLEEYIESGWIKGNPNAMKGAIAMMQKRGYNYESDSKKRT